MKTFIKGEIMYDNLNQLSDFIETINDTSCNEDYIGSDKYLDSIIKINKSLDAWIEAIKDINDSIRKQYPSTKENALEITKNLNQLLDGMNLLIFLFKGDEITLKSFKTRIKCLEHEMDQIQKCVLDIEKITLRKL